jgi:hypothetical protein
MIHNRFFKQTPGIQAEFIIAKSLDISGASSTPQATFELFVTNGIAGALGVFWEDTHAALAAGDTALAANVGRKFFYGYKLGDGTVRVSTGIPCKPKYKTAAFNAGTGDAWTATIAGTISATQRVLLKIQDTAGGMTPYPVYSYEVPYNTSNTQTAADLATAINAETEDKILSASAASGVITITCTDKNRTIQVLVPTLITTVAANTDASSFSVAHTVKGVLPLGTYQDALDIERIAHLNQGGIEYSPEGTKPSEFDALTGTGGVPYTNVSSSVNYGFVVVTATRREEGQGSVHPVSKLMYTIVMIATASISTLAAY